MKLENNTLWIKDCRLSFPNLLVAKATQGGVPKFNCNFVMEPDAVEFQELKEIVWEMAQAKWGDNAQAVMTMISQDKRLRCYGNGNEKISNKTMKVYEGFEDKVYISASNDTQPKLYGADAIELPPTANANQLFVGGNYVAGIVSFWLQDNTHGRAVRANLDGVQYLREGEHYGSAGPDTAGIFQPAPGAPAPTAAAPGAPVAPANPLDFI